MRTLSHAIVTATVGKKLELERVMPWGEAHNIMIPSSWSPTALRDSDLVQVQIEQGADKTIITLERVRQ